MLSDAKIRSLKPKEKAYKVYDDRRLYMVVNPNGSRWWRFKYKYDGRERGISLGVYPDVTLQYAREQLQDARQLLARGIDPSAQRRTVKIARAHTFKMIAEEWLEMQAERLAPITMGRKRGGFWARSSKGCRLARAATSAGSRSWRSATPAMRSGRRIPSTLAWVRARSPRSRRPRC